MKKYQKILIIVIMVPWTLFAMELFLRTMAPVPMLPRYIQSTSFGIRFNMPNETYQHKTPDYTVTISTNAHGIRSPQEYTYNKPSNVKRIVMVGDSFGMGYGVNFEDTFSERLRTKLEKKYGKVELINLSSSGHGNAEELLMLQNMGFQYHPDLILLSFHGTDNEENTRSGLFSLENGGLIPKNSTYLPGVKLRERLFKNAAYRWIAGNCHLYNLARHEIAKKVKLLLSIFRSPPQNTEPTSASRAAQNEVSPKEQLTIALLNKIKQEASANGAKLLLLDIPMKITRDRFDSRFPHTAAEKSSSNFHIVSPIETFEANSSKLLYWERSHGHFTPFGCKLVGDLLAQYTIEHKLLESSTDDL